MNDYQLGVICRLLRELLEINQQIHRELLKIVSSPVGEEISEHHGEYTEFDRM